MQIPSAPLALIVSLNEQGPRIRFPIHGGTVTLGRDPNNQVLITDDPLVSRAHCVIRAEESGLLLEDLHSRNGTFLDGERIVGPVPLRVPSSLTLGATQLAIVPAPTSAQQLTAYQDGSYTLQHIDSRMGSVFIPANESFEVRTEHFLVVDIIDSTHLIEQSDLNFARAILALGQNLQRGLERTAYPFLQCTGDGFFACFDDADLALETAARLGPSVARHVLPTIRVSVALHWGPARNTGNGGKAGRDVYAVFALEKLRHAIAALDAESHTPSTESFIVMTEQFWSRLRPEAQTAAQSVGAYMLRGLSQPVTVMRWRPPAATADLAGQHSAHASEDDSPRAL
jgi:class 3 adenylate cyclase